MSDQDWPSDSDLIRKVRRSLLRLPPRRRNIFLLNRVEGWSYAEIAEAYGIAVSRVRRHMRIAMQVLMSEVFRDEPQSWWQRWRP